MQWHHIRDRRTPLRNRPSAAVVISAKEVGSQTRISFSTAQCQCVFGSFSSDMGTHTVSQPPMERGEGSANRVTWFRRLPPDDILRSGAQVAGFAELLFNAGDRLFEGACDVPTLLAPAAFAGAHIHQLQPRVRPDPTFN